MTITIFDWRTREPMLQFERPTREQAVDDAMELARRIDPRAFVDGDRAIVNWEPKR